MANFFPDIKSPQKSTTSICAVIFEELDAAVSLLQTVRSEFNPMQQSLIGRFLVACKIFGHEMMLADGSSDALRTTLGIPRKRKNTETEETLHPSEQGIISNICTEICNDLDKIGQSVQGELLHGVTDVVESIRDSYDLGVSETDTLNSIASSIRHLSEQVASLFEAQPYLLQRQLAAYQSSINIAAGDTEESPRITAEQFMEIVKPPERKPTLRDRVIPFIPELIKLRRDGYTYTQCAQFLEQNGIKAYVSAISTIMNETK
ncbi:hypothetical protein [Pseudomonas alabamensis]|uniref:hypothetical protein n=1 Tax=Pseudomonas alabamensis TaxID=3064349 RepID=UPI0021D91052|nr:hypothetical protein [Pseudomonas entomophila]